MNAKYFLFAPFFVLLIGESCQTKQDTSGWPGVTPDSSLPTPEQITYQQKEKIAFVHFGINTFTNREWGTGNEDPTLFNPTNFDADQWARALSETGFETLIMTVKHHDGFCLWPSEYTDHDITSTPYKDGNGDIVEEVSKACKKYGLDFGIYLSPWDIHEASYGTPKYNRFYMNQLRELLTNYGPVAKVWFDGAKGEDAKDMEYDFETWWKMVQGLQLEALIFSDEGPDIRRIGNELSFVGKTNWSTIDRDSVTIEEPNQEDYLNTGQLGAPDWVVGECDVSIRPGWFYHPGEDDEVKTVEELTDIYFKSVGRNCTLLLNIPPDTAGQFHSRDIKRLYAFSDTLSAIFDEEHISTSTIEASSNGINYPSSNAIDNNWNSFWIAANDDKQPSLTIHFDNPVTFDLIMLQEFIAIGQRVAKFSISIPDEIGWQPLEKKTTIGHKRIVRLDKTTTLQSFGHELNIPQLLY